jgi:hypothetical protein
MNPELDKANPAVQCRPKLEGADSEPYNQSGEDFRMLHRIVNDPKFDGDGDVMALRNLVNDHRRRRLHNVLDTVFKAPTHWRPGAQMSGPRLCEVREEMHAPAGTTGPRSGG